MDIDLVMTHALVLMIGLTLGYSIGRPQRP